MKTTSYDWKKVAELLRRLLLAPWWPGQPDVRVIAGLGGTRTYLAVRIPGPDPPVFVARVGRRERGPGWHSREAGRIREAAWLRLVRWRQSRNPPMALDAQVSRR